MTTKDRLVAIRNDITDALARFTEARKKLLKGGHAKDFTGALDLVEAELKRAVTTCQKGVE